MNEGELQTTESRIELWLFVVSMATIAVIVTAALRENFFNEWRPLRTRYSDILAEKATDELGKAAARQFEVRLVQNYLPALNAVDRCATCHAGVQDPRMADQEQPFKTHPGRYLEIHDPEKFGCTVCHDGQGRATETEEAHGRAPFWDYPMLETRYVVTSCTKCHEGQSLFGSDGFIAKASGPETGESAAALLDQGRGLVTTLGCIACHTMNGKGGIIGPELSFVGNKTKHEFDFSHLGAEEPREVGYWLKQHFMNPQRVSPGSKMPPVKQGEDAADALTAYMLSLQRKESSACSCGAHEGQS